MSLNPITLTKLIEGTENYNFSFNEDFNKLDIFLDLVRVELDNINKQIDDILANNISNGPECESQLSDEFKTALDIVIESFKTLQNRLPLNQIDGLLGTGANANKKFLTQADINSDFVIKMIVTESLSGSVDLSINTADIVSVPITIDPVKYKIYSFWSINKTFLKDVIAPVSPASPITLTIQPKDLISGSNGFETRADVTRDSTTAFGSIINIDVFVIGIKK